MGTYDNRRDKMVPPEIYETLFLPFSWGANVAALSPGPSKTVPEWSDIIQTMRLAVVKAIITHDPTYKIIIEKHSVYYVKY